MVAASQGKIGNRGMLHYHTWLRECVHRGWLREVIWVPAQSILSDAGTKWKEGKDLCWELFSLHCIWKPFHLPHLEADFMVWIGGTPHAWRADPSWTLT